MKTDWRDFFLETMEKRFLEIRAKNDRFSARRFAAMAKVSPGTMSMILSRSKEWSLSSERAITVLKNVKVETGKINILALMCSPAFADAEKPLPEADEEAFLINPYYMPICLAFSLTSPPTIRSLALSLKIPEARVASIIDDLIKRGYLLNQNGKVTKGHPKSYHSGDGPSSQAVRTHHLNNLEKVREALICEPPEKRDISGVLLTGNSAQMEAVKNEIRQFYSRVHTILNSSEPSDDVFRIFVGFAPLHLNSATKD